MRRFKNPIKHYSGPVFYFGLFQNIPKKVTLNEYIEISKYYSTPKSSGFINGILDQAVSRLETTEKIRKIGRGLMD